MANPLLNLTDSARAVYQAPQLAWFDAPVAGTELLFVPSYTSELDKIPTVNRAQFGDGYSQRAPQGINSNLEQWPTVIFDKRSDADAAAIMAFFDALEGATAFTWTRPGTLTAKKYVCQSHKQVYNDSGSNTITCVFMEVVG